MFENKIANTGIHYSRYIASFVKISNRRKVPFYPGLFEEWLEQLGNLNEDEISDIVELSRNGKMELESNALMFLTKKLERM